MEHNLTKSEKARARRLANRVLYKKQCAVCQNSFETARESSLYCDPACYRQAQVIIRGKNRRRKEGLPAEGALQRTCIVCQTSFDRDNPNQKRCARCIANPERAAPLCACGCGEKTAWQPTIGYAKFCIGHNFRIHGVAFDPLYRYQCVNCMKQCTANVSGRRYCSFECRDEHNRGENHARYKGGRTTYKNVWDENRNRYRREHRVVMEAHLGRLLAWHEIVHHIDENGHSNEISNLWAFHCDRCHHHHHATGAALSYRYREAHVVNGVAVGLPKRKPHQKHKRSRIDPSDGFADTEAQQESP